MRKIAIVSDSTCDLSEAIIKDNNIHIIPLFVNFGEESYLDLVEMNGRKVFDMVEQTKIHPQSAARSPQVFKEKFSELIDEGFDIVYTGIGSGFSASFQNATLGASELPEDRVFLVDSQNLSSGIGLLIMKAISFREQGLSAKEIKEKLDDIVPRVRSQFVINTLEYLHRGGRCSGTARIFGTLLKLRPLIKVVDGGMIVAKKPRGSLTKAIDVMLADFEKDVDNMDMDTIFITHAAADEEATYIREKITPLAKDANIIETYAGSVISTHCGPKTIGVLYILKE